jgi:G3E family GTPase
MASLLDALAARHGASLLRMKGILSISGMTDAVAVHAVQGLFYPPEVMNGFVADVATNRIVLIGQNLDLPIIAEDLRNRLLMCATAKHNLKSIA